MKTGSCSKCGYLSLCDEHRKQALADNFDAIKNMSRPANPPTPTVLETSLEDMLAEAAKRGGELGYQRGFQDALERAAKKLDDRIASLQKCEGNTYLQICECSVMARAIRALSENGDTCSHESSMKRGDENSDWLCAVCGAVKKRGTR